MQKKLIFTLALNRPDRPTVGPPLEAVLSIFVALKKHKTGALSGISATCNCYDFGFFVILVKC